MKGKNLEDEIKISDGADLNEKLQLVGSRKVQGRIAITDFLVDAELVKFKHGAATFYRIRGGVQESQLQDFGDGLKGLVPGKSKFYWLPPGTVAIELPCLHRNTYHIDYGIPRFILQAQETQSRYQG